MALIAYLKGDDLQRPMTITSAELPPMDTRLGEVTSMIQHGELFLHPKGNKKRWFRLRWRPKDEVRERPLPVGSYVLTGYRQLATADDGKEWIWSTASAGYKQIDVKAGETVHIEVRDWIGLNTRAVFRKGKHRVGLLFMAEKKLGNTLYRDGKRITIQWQLRNLLGEVLADGPMRYG